VRLTNSDWHEWAADGVTVRSFNAKLDGAVITLFVGDRRLLELQAPARQTSWAESQPVEFDGHSFVLLARRLDRQRTLVDLFEDGRGCGPVTRSTRLGRSGCQKRCSSIRSPSAV
jgi:hypothetical protein